MSLDNDVLLEVPDWREQLFQATDGRSSGYARELFLCVVPDLKKRLERDCEL